jgi:hypothetical protein
MGRGMHDNCVCSEHDSSWDSEEHDSQRSYHLSEAQGWTLQDIWVSSIHSCTQGEEDQARTFRQKEYISWVCQYSKAYWIYILGQR